MNKLIVASFIVLLGINFASATTQISIYIDSSGSAQFLGETTEQISLPEGITSENGNIRGTTQELTFKQGEVWRFSYNLENSEINVILPDGAEIINLEDGEISLRNSRLSIYVPGKINVEYKIIGKSSSSIYVWSLLIFLAILIGYVAWKKRKNKTDLKDSGAVMRILNDREKKIIEELRKSGKIKSSYLRRLCDIPKASFSRHVHELERKKLVKLSGEGKNKFVDLA